MRALQWCGIGANRRLSGVRFDSRFHIDVTMILTQYAAAGRAPAACTWAQEKISITACRGQPHSQSDAKKDGAAGATQGFSIYWPVKPSGGRGRISTLNRAGMQCNKMVSEPDITRSDARLSEEDMQASAWVAIN